MDNIGSSLAGGGITGLVFGIVYLLYKYCDKHKINCISGCCKVTLEQDRTPPTSKEEPPLTIRT